MSRHQSQTAFLYPTEGPSLNSFFGTWTSKANAETFLIETLGFYKVDDDGEPLLDDNGKKQLDIFNGTKIGVVENNTIVEYLWNSSSQSWQINGDQLLKEAKTYALALKSNVWHYQGKQESLSVLQGKVTDNEIVPVSGDVWYCVSEQKNYVASTEKDEDDKDVWVWTEIASSVTATQLTTEINAVKSECATTYQTKLDESAQTVLESGITAELVGKIGQGSAEVDTTNSLITVKSGNDTYFVKASRLTKPSAPSVSVKEYSVVDGTVDVAITFPSGSTLQVKKGSGSWTTNSGTYSIVTGYADNTDNTVIKESFKMRATKNGLTSDEVDVTITVTPKVKSGSVAVSRTPNNNNWATGATITVSPSATKGATSEYTTNGQDWVTFTSDKSFSVSESKNAELYQVRAKKTGYADADIVKNEAFTLNAKKAYYGFSTKSSLGNETDIKALESTGGSKEKTKFSDDALVINPTGTTLGYVWLCCTSAVSNKDAIVPNKGDIFPFGFEAYTTVGSYKCYRSINTIAIETTNVYVP